jgi:hypothetical protein
MGLRKTRNDRSRNFQITIEKNLALDFASTRLAFFATLVEPVLRYSKYHSMSIAVKIKSLIASEKELDFPYRQRKTEQDAAFRHALANLPERVTRKRFRGLFLWSPICGWK